MSDSYITYYLNGGNITFEAVRKNLIHIFGLSERFGIYGCFCCCCFIVVFFAGGGGQFQVLMYLIST